MENNPNSTAENRRFTRLNGRTLFHNTVFTEETAKVPTILYNDVY